MTPIRLTAALGLTVLAAAAAASKPARAQDYVWHAAIPGESVQYGVPDTDDRGLRIDCEGRGRLSIMGPTASEGAEGSALDVRLRVPPAPPRTVPGDVIALGDGANFHVVVAPGDPALAALLAGKDLTVGSAGDVWTVPGAGAPRVLADLLAACAAAPPSAP
ncbi:MAG: hypothetical protein Q7T19_15000 [Caulobacter sp.]|nr:hypothetical protein [Caulobacter sp.]